MKKIALVAPGHVCSPHHLGQNLQWRLRQAGHTCEVFEKLDFLSRLVPRDDSNDSLHFWARKRVSNAWRDWLTLNCLKGFDAIVILECIPRAFDPSYLGITALRKKTQKPIFIYEVFSPHNAPSIDARISRNYGLNFREYYDGLLHVSPVTEVRSDPLDCTWGIGMASKGWELGVRPKPVFTAVVDFEQAGYEGFRQDQIDVLEELNIPYVSLEGRYSLNEIREYYASASVFFLQFPESFGQPICECLNYGTQVFAADKYWAMSWRMGEQIRGSEDGELPSCFSIYSDKNDLRNKLVQFRDSFHSLETPRSIRSKFEESYAEYFHGNNDGFRRWLESF